jgi:glycosyltransferase involved in cell wall biosynthesis
MKFSIILCTYNNPKGIKEVIESVVKQKIKKTNLDFILAAHKLNNNAVNIIKNILKKKKINFTKLNSKKKGKSNGLEKSLDFAKGEYAVVLDDDNVLYFDFLKEAKKFLEKHKNVGCLGSQGMVDKKLSLPSWFKTYKSHYAIGTIARGSDWVWGACSIIKISAWKSLRANKFKFYLNPSRLSHLTPIKLGGEDVEISLAMILHGYQVKFNPKQKFIHKFNQNRLTENYFFNNLIGSSKSIPVLEAYRTFKFNLSLNQLKFIWILKILKIILNSFVKSIINLFLLKKFEIKYYFLLATTVLKTFAKTKNFFFILYNNTIKIKKI